MADRPGDKSPTREERRERLDAAMLKRANTRVAELEKVAREVAEELRAFTGDSVSDEAMLLDSLADRLSPGREDGTE